MSHLVSIDPDTDKCGVCAWSEEGQLISAVSWPASTPYPQGADNLVCELMPVYPTDSMSMRQSLHRVCIAAGRVTAHYPDTVWVLPARWKGQVPKHIHHERLLAAATEPERVILLGKKRTKNRLSDILDAYGIGLWYLYREGVRR